MARRGFSLIELVVVVGIFSALFSSALAFGLPQYSHYASKLGKDTFIDELLDIRSQTVCAGGVFDPSVIPKSLVDKADNYQINIDQDGFFDGI